MLDGFKKVVNEKVEEGTRGAIDKIASDFSQVMRSSPSSTASSNYAYEQGYYDSVTQLRASLPSFVCMDPERLLELRGSYMKGYNDGLRELVKEANRRRLREQAFKSGFWALGGIAVGLGIGMILSRKKGG